jgi:hypothetical protein
MADGIKGKFNERLTNIRMSKLRKKTLVMEDGEVIYKNFLKVIAAIPLMVYDNVSHFDTDKNISKEFKETKNNDINKLNQRDNIVSTNKNNLRVKYNNDKKLIEQIDISEIKMKQKQAEYNFKTLFNGSVNNTDINENGINNTNNVNNNFYDNMSSNIVDSKELEKKIINLIKKNLIKTVNELEILQSELYLLSEVNGDDKTLNECREALANVKDMLYKVDSLKKKYDFLKDNYDFEYMLEIDDKELVDNIILLKDKFSNNEVKATVADYKLLNVYKCLYLKIDKLEEDTIKFEEEKEKKLQEIKERDIDFEKLKKNVYNVSRMNVEYKNFINRQNDYLEKLNKDISKINEKEIYSYKLNGFNALLFNSFKYVGLLMLSPLKGIIPAISTETLITKNVVANLYNNLEWEESKKLVYEAIDYSGEINRAINDLNYTSDIVDSTLDDIVRLKIQYNQQFKKYQGDFLEYEKVIGKINDMENKILGNKIKIEIMKKHMLDKERENYKKLELVDKLNKNMDN